ncbi:hypothetical protein BAUCODRAFT_144067 [Baudoinia panamericana UAMH 10762]|uniref:Uncharacterized protein n=1 Tax=Baudoinia panamericana (strain UAMH 10762) TaxID=717646 RepID=M2N8C0_BAUPA|nr:uncharacterized protein BAUCODRAFT_144067 [Baudoinia panamericana UAMH 10762]EMD00389.1 hypothetical protein BAUCODRAFT_144067 [Baudoinia panamericana UAMH 10762]
MDNIALPVQLDAFILNKPVVEEGETLIAPITQPDYVSLRLDAAVLQHDLLPAIDLHNAKPATGNPRVSKVYSAPFENLQPDVPAPQPASIGLDQSRFGVYLHWTVPRGYRTGVSKDQPLADRNDATQQNASKEAAQPTFKQVPDRWLLVRILRNFEPKSAKIEPVTAWIIESNRLSTLDELSSDVDLETEVTPFVAYNDDATTNPDLLNNQAEMYIGYKTPLQGWSEDQKVRRVPLTTMNSSNPLFADYAIHNPNVFSTSDNFAYGDGSQFLTSATCDYVVIGWHSTVLSPGNPSPPPTDPLIELPAMSSLDRSLRGRLQAMFCQLPTGVSHDAANAPDGRRLVCYSALYNVKYDVTEKPSTPSDTYAKNFTASTDMEPVSIGTSPLDAILTFLEAHQDPSDAAWEGSLLNDVGSSTARTLRSMTELLYASEDTYDERIKAADLLYDHNFTRSGGRFVWRYDKKKASVNANGQTIVDADPPATPGAVEAEDLARLNNMQKIADASTSKLQLLQFSLFAEFFKFASDNDGTSRTSIYSSRIQQLRDEGRNLKSKLDMITEEIFNKSKELTVQRFADESFFSKNDPTLCIAGLDSGWPVNYMENVPTRLTSSFGAPQNPALAGMVQPTLDLIERMPLASDLTSTIGKVLREASGGLPADVLGHLAWSQEQPFRPQFIEWEGVYYHVGDFDSQWDIGLDYTGTSESNHEQLRYINPSPLYDPANPTNATDPQQDSRHLWGRILLLPQPSFALAAVVNQVLSTATDDQLPAELKDPDPKKAKALKDAFVAACGKLRFVSGQLTGVSDALLTLANGQHMKPNLRSIGQLPVPMKAAVDFGQRYLGMTEEDFVFMDSQTAKTPYGTLTDFGADPKYEVFKPVQHGQFVITNITIVDKFGQAIAAPPPARTPYDAPVFHEAIHPCLSDRLLPTVMPDKTLNVVFSPQQVQPDAPTHSGYPMSPFIQLTPSINQDCRANACFVQKNGDGNGKFLKWSPSNTWENPIFGWVIVNYADSALQFFTAAGLFYTSVRFGGPFGLIQSQKWLPFDEPPSATASVSDQLRDLVAKLVDGTPMQDSIGKPTTTGIQYTLALWNTIETAIQSMPQTPTSYASTANAIVGKPLALVNVGWSLELAQPPLWPQYTPHEPPDLATLRQKAADEMGKYRFKVKIGDRDRPFDGVVVYWDSQNQEALDNRHGPGSTVFDTFYCFPRPSTPPEPADTPGYPRTFIDPDNFPKLQPYFLDPDAAVADSTDFLTAHASHLMIKTLLIDPYAPIHLYSGILPIKRLQLPGWVLSEPTKNMTAFFSMGPLLMTKDVPKKWNQAKKATPTSWLSSQGTDIKDAGKPDIQLTVAGTKGQWRWLQPYSRFTDDGKPTTEYMTLTVGQEDGATRSDPAPYTFVEGFLQLAAPLLPPAHVD